MYDHVPTWMNVAEKENRAGQEEMLESGGQSNSIIPCQVEPPDMVHL